MPPIENPNLEDEELETEEEAGGGNEPEAEADLELGDGEGRSEPAGKRESPADLTSLRKLVEQQNALIARRDEEWRREKQDYERKLQEQNDRLRRAVLGEDDPNKKAAFEQKKEQVRKAFEQYFPELVPLLRGEAGGEREPTFEERRFYQETQKRAFEMAKSEGFTTDVQQEAIAVLGDIIIHKTPAWHERFYKKGDISVIDEVGEFMRKEIIGPFKQAVRKEVLAEIRRTGKLGIPELGSGAAPAASKGEKKLKLPKDLKNPDSRKSLLEGIYERAIASEGEA